MHESMNLMRNSKRAVAAVAAAILGLVEAVRVGPQYHAPAPPTVASYTPQPQSNT